MPRVVAVPGGDSPAPRRSLRAQPADLGRVAGAARSGFSAMKAHTRATSKKKEFNDFKVDYDHAYVIAFLEPENYFAYATHRLQAPGDDGEPRWTRRNCLRDPDSERPAAEQCPLCAIGHEPQPLALFNVVDLEDPSTVRRWEASPGIFDKIVELAEELAAVPEDKGGPLDLNSPGVYAKVSKKKNGKGKRGFTEYSVTRVKERDIEEDFDGIRPLSGDERAALLQGLNTGDDVKFGDYDELAEFAATLED